MDGRGSGRDLTNGEAGALFVSLDLDDLVIGGPVESMRATPNHQPQQLPVYTFATFQQSSRLFRKRTITTILVIHGGRRRQRLVTNLFVLLLDHKKDACCGLVGLSAPTRLL